MQFQLLHWWPCSTYPRRSNFPSHMWVSSQKAHTMLTYPNHTPILGVFWKVFRASARASRPHYSLGVLQNFFVFLYRSFSDSLPASSPKATYESSQPEAWQHPKHISTHVRWWPSAHPWPWIVTCKLLMTHRFVYSREWGAWIHSSKLWG